MRGHRRSLVLQWFILRDPHPRTAHSAKLDQEHQSFFTRTPDILARWPEIIGHVDDTLSGVIDFRYEGDATHGLVVLGMTGAGTRRDSRGKGNGDHRAQKFGLSCLGRRLSSHSLGPADGEYLWPFPPAWLCVMWESFKTCFFRSLTPS